MRTQPDSFRPEPSRWRSGFRAVFILTSLTAGTLVCAADQIIYPRPAGGTATAAAPLPSGDGSSRWLIVFAVVAAAVGAWLLWRRRSPGWGGTASARKLAVTETRSLGNRQYLVVADYEGRKFLLGVCPGRIDMLAPLSDDKK